MARPTKYTPEVGEKLCTAVRHGLTYKLAAAYAGVHYDTLNEWRRGKPEFSDALTRAEAEGALARMLRIEKAASDGDWRAAAWIQERRYPQDYGRTVEQKVEHSGAVVHTDADIDAQLDAWARKQLGEKLDQLADRRQQYEQALRAQAAEVEPVEAEPRLTPPAPAAPPRRREPMPPPGRDYAFGPEDRDEERGVWQRWA
jgi:transposase